MNSTTLCSDLSSYPFPISGAVGGLLDGNPVICGGYSSSIESSCYKYNKTSDTWNFHGNMKHTRYHHASTVVDGTLMVTEGYSDGYHSTEYIGADGSALSGQNLPGGRYGHRAVTLHDNRVMIIGGYPYPSGSSQTMDKMRIENNL